VAKDNKTKVSIGKIMTAHGLHGYAKILPLTDFPERFEQIKTVYLFRGDEQIKEAEIEKVRFTGSGQLLVKFSFLNTPEEVKQYTNCLLKIPEEDKLVLPEDFFYIDDLKGMNVYLISGELLGKVKDVYFAGNNVLEILTNKNKEVMVPFVKDFVPEVDLFNKKIIIKPIPGLLEDDETD